MNPLISVVIPVYNVENLLHYAVDSLLEQDYKNIEIILVNDGSKDKSGEVCDDYASKYDNVYVFHKENGGQSSARNLGLKYCHGEYIGFIDSDDWVSRDMYSYLYTLLKEYDADVSSIAIQAVENHDFVAGTQIEDIIVKDGLDVIRYYMEKTTKSDGYSVCRCLFKRELLEGISFREGKFYEDIDYKYLALRNANRYVESNLIKYYYLQTQISTSFAGFKKKEFQLLEASDILYNLSLETNDEEIIYYAKVRKARDAYSLLARIAYLGFADNNISKQEQISIVQYFTKKIRSNYKFLMCAPLPLSRKITLTLLCINFKCLQIPMRLYRLLKR